MVIHVQPKVRFKCTLCGECCRRYWITVTLDDLLAIYANLSLKPSQVAALYNSNMASDWNAPRIRLGNGQYYLVLRKRMDGSCIFNEWRGGKMICTIHSFKPLTCRFYPFIYSWRDDVLYFEVYSKAVGYCPGIGKGPIVNLTPEAKYAELSRIAKERFRRLVDHWNSRVVKSLSKATADDFLRFLDCVVEALLNKAPVDACPSEYDLGRLIDQIGSPSGVYSPSA